MNNSKKKIWSHPLVINDKSFEPFIKLVKTITVFCELNDQENILTNLMVHDILVRLLRFSYGSENVRSVINDKTKLVHNELLQELMIVEPNFLKHDLDQETLTKVYFSKKKPMLTINDIDITFVKHYDEFHKFDKWQVLGIVNKSKILENENIKYRKNIIIDVDNLSGIYYNTDISSIAPMIKQMFFHEQWTQLNSLLSLLGLIDTNHSPTKSSHEDKSKTVA